MVEKEESNDRISRSNLKESPGKAGGLPRINYSVKATSRFLVYQNRLQTETTLFVGRREDVLVRAGDGWQIRRRLIYLSQNVLLAKALTTFF